MQGVRQHQNLVLGHASGSVEQLQPQGLNLRVREISWSIMKRLSHGSGRYQYFHSAELSSGFPSCNDDTGGSLNPGVTYRTPASGQYDVWVGVFGSDTPTARLRITEME